MSKPLQIIIGIAILIIAFSVFYYFVIFKPQKEEAKLEQQRQEQLVKEEQERQALEQEQKEYVAKRKRECYDIYLQEKKNWTNTKDFEYNETRDICLVWYESDEPAKTREECDKFIIDTFSPLGAYDFSTKYDAYNYCLLNWFSKTF